MDRVQARGARDNRDPRHGIFLPLGGCEGSTPFHLRPIHLRPVGGLLHACLPDGPPANIQNLIDVMEPRLAPYDLRNAKVACKPDLVEKGNLKLTIENNRECYHCSANHPELRVSFIDLDLGFGFGPESLAPEDGADAERELPFSPRGWLSQTT